MLVGRLGKPHLHLSQDAEGAATIQVELNLVDPFHKIKSAALCYLSADEVAAKPKPADRLQALPGCHQVSLKIQDNVALGQFPVKKGLSRLRILYQGVSVNDGGRQRFTASVEETVELPAAGAAGNIAANHPPQQPADGSKDNTLPPKHNPSPKRGGNPRPNDAAEPPKSPEDFDALVNSGDASRRIRATMRLLRVKPREPNRAVAKALEGVLLKDGASPIRCNAAVGLANRGMPESIPALQEAAQKDPDSIVRSRATKAIEAIKLRQLRVHCGAGLPENGQVKINLFFAASPVAHKTGLDSTVFHVPCATMDTQCGSDTAICHLQETSNAGRLAGVACGLSSTTRKSNFTNVNSARDCVRCASSAE